MLINRPAQSIYSSWIFKYCIQSLMIPMDPTFWTFHDLIWKVQLEPDDMGHLVLVLVITHTHTHARKCTFYRECARLRLVQSHLSLDLHEI